MSEWHSQVETETQNAGGLLPTPAPTHGTASTASEQTEAAAGQTEEIAGQVDAGNGGVADVAPGEPAAEEPAAEGPQLIDRLSERLRELDELPVSEHPARYEALHSELSEALTVLDRAARSDAGAGQQRR